MKCNCLYCCPFMFIRAVSGHLNSHLKGQIINQTELKFFLFSNTWNMLCTLTSLCLTGSIISFFWLNYRSIDEPILKLSDCAISDRKSFRFPLISSRDHIWVCFCLLFISTISIFVFCIADCYCFQIKFCSVNEAL